MTVKKLTETLDFMKLHASVQISVVDKKLDIVSVSYEALPSTIRVMKARA